MLFQRSLIPIPVQHVGEVTTTRSAPQPYRRGYASPPQLRAEIAAAHATCFARTLAVALTDIVVLLIAAVGAAQFAVRLAPPALGAPVVVLAALLVGRQLRALECLVHEGSHYNWDRRHRAVNDVAATLLAAVPTGASLSVYRQGHLRHHGRFGTPDDPDRRRYEELSLEAIPRNDLRTFVVATARRLPRYQRGWFAEVGASPARSLLPHGWALLVVVTPSALLAGPVAGGVAGAVWLLAYLLMLPIVRLVGEGSEHVYSSEDTVFDATVTNLGRLQRLLFHPHGDGYHTLHHMWPGVPHHRLVRLHRTLMTRDPAYAQRLRVRTRVLSWP